MFACEICDRKFLYKNSVNRHFRREHINKESRRKLKCTECNYECRFYQDLRTHIYVDHGIVCKVDHRMFSNLEEFNYWKREFEESSHYMYVKHSSAKISATTNEKKTYYVCHRTGTFQSGSCGKRRLKRQGSNKINASCPSTMEVVESLHDGTVKLVLWKTHAGHNAEVSRTFFSSNERNWLAARINEGVNYQNIMSEIQSLGNKGGRMCYLKSQDIRNMKKNLISSRNKNILSDIRLWVKNVQYFQKTDAYPIVYFKDRNMIDPNKKIPNKEVMLIIMTKFQKTILENFNFGIVCLDATYCQTNYEYQLITLYVADIYNYHWSPVVYCVTSYIDCVSVHHFLTKLKEEIGLIECAVLLCDDNPPFYKVWCDIMSKPRYYFLHTWYVEKNWKENILKLKCSDSTKAVIYKTLKMLLIEENMKSFESLLEKFIDSLRYDSRLLDFYSYFQNNFAKRTAIWAGCFKKIANLKTDSEITLDSIHKRLNKEFRDGIDCEKITECLTTLILISHNCQDIQDIITQTCITVDEKRLNEIQKGHKRGICIKRTEINQLTPNIYKINSLGVRSRNITYEIHFVNIKECRCFLKCNTCKICTHEYTCSCIDYAINFNMCEHIHACAILRNRIQIDLTAETDEPLDSFVEEVICEEEIICNVENFCEENEREEINEKHPKLAQQNEIIKNNRVTNNEYCSKLKGFDSSVELLSENLELNLKDETSLPCEPFTFVSTDAIENYNHTEAQLEKDSFQIVTFQNDEKYEAILVTDTNSCPFDDPLIYENVIPEKTAIISLDFISDGSDSFICRKFDDDNKILKHKVDSLLGLTDFDNAEEHDIELQLDSDINTIEMQDFQNCYGVYDLTEENNIALSL